MKKQKSIEHVILEYLYFNPDVICDLKPIYTKLENYTYFELDMALKSMLTPRVDERGFRGNSFITVHGHFDMLSNGRLSDNKVSELKDSIKARITDKGKDFYLSHYDYWRSLLIKAQVVSTPIAISGMIATIVLNTCTYKANKKSREEDLHSILLLQIQSDNHEIIQKNISLELKELQRRQTTNDSILKFSISTK